MKPEYELKVLKELPRSDIMLQFVRNRYKKNEDGTISNSEHVTFNIPLTKLYELMNGISGKIKEFKSQQEVNNETK